MLLDTHLKSGNSRVISRGSSLGRVEQARKTIEQQALAIAGLSAQLDRSFDRAVDLILSTRGKTVFCGMGKSGLIARKLAATFSSTGTPSIYMHPGDAIHGDLGMVSDGDIAVLLSYSGETEEVVRLLPLLRRMEVPTISIVGERSSTLGQQADITLTARVDGEVCPNGLAPTTSTLAAMALGDALAVTLIRERAFSPRDFAQRHPGGSLGRSLLTRVRDEMRSEDLPIVKPSTPLTECVLTMNGGRLGLALVLDGHCLAGIVTDGDLRRAMSAGRDLCQMTVKEIMSHNPKTIHEGAMLAEAEERMQRDKVKALVVVDESGKLAGVLDIFR